MMIRFNRLTSSIWLFPAVVTIALLLLVALKVNGSSIGAYGSFFYGNEYHDPSLILGHPRDIRSDEWMTNTQMTLAQTNNHFNRINDNIGQGQDMSVVLDVPYADWSQVFRPQNWAFYVLPFDFAFAFKWWILAYLLVLSCYFFVMTILPGKRLLAASLSISLLFSPLVQWWYQYITLAPIFYSFFSAVVFMRLIKAKLLKHALLWGTLLSYLLICFALVLYPPFQIACGLVLGFFVAGYLLHTHQTSPTLLNRKKIGVILGVPFVTTLVVALFVFTRSAVVKIINDTVYPGERVVTSGGFDIVHAFAGHVGFNFQFLSKANFYRVGDGGALNQSEASNFILLLPFLLLPALYFVFLDLRRRQKPDWLLATTLAGSLLLLSWMFIPGLSLIGSLTLLDKVPMTRLLIGVGLANFLLIIFTIRRLQNETDKDNIFRNKTFISIYTFLILIGQLLIGLWVQHRSPGFISTPIVIASSIPVPLTIFWLLHKRFTLAAVTLATFSIITSGAVNPIYRGTAMITETPLAEAIKSIAQTDKGAWATDIGHLENFPAANGARAYSGLYTYPQFDVWKSVGNSNDSDIYNRYAHVLFAFDRQPKTEIPTQLSLTSVDRFELMVEPCGEYMRQKDIRYILTGKQVDEPCTTLERTVKYPAQNFFIYKINNQ